MPVTVSLDFDGVLRYPGTVPGKFSVFDEPVPGALEALRYLMTRYCVFILTARDVTEVIAWLEHRGFPTDTDNGSPTWEVPGVLLVTNRKLPAVLYLDNRALRFWSWQQAIQEIDFFATAQG